MLSDETLEWFSLYLKRALAATALHKSWRLGQAYYSTLAEMRPDLAAKIRGTYLDPYYSNTAIPQYLAWLIEAVTGDTPVVEEPTDGSDA